MTAPKAPSSHGVISIAGVGYSGAVFAVAPAEPIPKTSVGMDRFVFGAETQNLTHRKHAFILKAGDIIPKILFETIQLVPIEVWKTGTVLSPPKFWDAWSSAWHNFSNKLGWGQAILNAAYYANSNVGFSHIGRKVCQTWKHSIEFSIIPKYDGYDTFIAVLWIKSPAAKDTAKDLPQRGIQKVRDYLWEISDIGASSAGNHPSPALGKSVVKGIKLPARLSGQEEDFMSSYLPDGSSMNDSILPSFPVVGVEQEFAVFPHSIEEISCTMFDFDFADYRPAQLFRIKSFILLQKTETGEDIITEYLVDENWGIATMGNQSEIIPEIVDAAQWRKP